MISFLVNKVEYLEKEMKILQEKYNISTTQNKKDISLLFEEIKLLKNKNGGKKRNKKKNKNKINEDNKTNINENDKSNVNVDNKNNINENNKNNIEASLIVFDSKITNINEIGFIINHFKKKIDFNNFNFKLLYRATTDGMIL